MTKALVFDMDGTLADLYAVQGWLQKLRAYDETPYRDAAPLYDAQVLIPLINKLKAAGFRIIITSWLSKESTKEYDKKVRQAKREWLKNYGFPYDEIHLVKYGTPKIKCSRKKADYQILVDDNAEVRQAWPFDCIDANENILSALEDLLAKEIT